MGQRRRASDGVRLPLLDPTDDEQPLWSSPTPATTGDRSGGGRRRSDRRALIAAGVAGAIVAIVVGANILGGGATPPANPVAAAPTTSTATITTATVPAVSVPVTTTVAAAAAPALIVDAPTGYRIVQVNEDDETASDGVSQLWVTQPGNAAESAWVDINTIGMAAGVAYEPPSAGQQRVPLASGVGLRSAVDGTTFLDAPVTGGAAYIDAFGVDVPTLVAATNGIQLIDGVVAPNPALTEHGFQLVASSTATDPSDAPSQRVRAIAMSSNDTPNNQCDPPVTAAACTSTRIDIVIGRPTTNFERARRAFTLRNLRVAIVAGGYTAIIGTLPGAEKQWIAIVDVDGTEVTFTSTNVDDLLAAAATLRPGTNDEWDDLEQTAAIANANNDPNEPTKTLDLQREGTFTNSTQWHANLITGGAGPRPTPVLDLQLTEPSIGDSSNWLRLDPALRAGQPGIQEAATAAGVVLVAFAPREQHGTHLAVAVGDTTLTDELTDPGADAPGIFGAVAFSDLAPFHAELQAADGTVLATLDGT